MSDDDNNNEMMKVKPKEYIDDKIIDVKDIIVSAKEEIIHRMEYRAEVTATALKEAKYELAAKLAIMNEWRDTVKDLIATFATRNELSLVNEQLKHTITRTEHDALCTKVSEIDRKLANVASTDDIKRLDKSLNSNNKWLISVLVILVMLLVGVIVDLLISK
jgi:vacuolar-type H+-ATPase subunit E/Vma4